MNRLQGSFLGIDLQFTRSLFSDAEIEDLLDKGKEVATSISKDTKKSDEERETARDVLDWIRDVRKTWNKDNSLHPNAVTKLMKITAIRQGKWGYINNRGKIPSDFRR